MTDREAGFYWVVCFRSDLQVARWDGDVWDFCGLESVGYAEPDDPTGDRVQVVSDRLVPPAEHIEQLRSIGVQVTASEQARNHVEFGKLGEHVDALFGSMSKLSK